LGISAGPSPKEIEVAKRKVYTVSKRTSKKGWKVKEKGGKVVAKAPTKTRAVRDGARVARQQKRSSLIIRKANGRIQEERMYPRGTGPARSKG
jgi:hypothetical protein